MRYHLLQKFFGKMVKIKETSFLSTRGMTLMFGNCSCVHDETKPFPNHHFGIKTLFKKFFGKMVKIKETSFLFTRGITLT